ncbi:MAG: hypothetical protein RLZZ267_914 [Bacillota bacterium]|jgi:uncharacterized protein YjdB
MKKVLSVLVALSLVVGLFAAIGSTASAAEKKIVVLVGNLQKALGAAGDWDPTDTKTAMYTADGKNYWFTGKLPAGDYEYKVALGGKGWSENYGADGKKDGDNIKISTGLARTITFFYNDDTHKITTSRHVTLVGSLQDKLGAEKAWDPTAAETQMRTVDGENYFFTGKLPAGEYEYKVAIAGSWTENYGAAGKAGGDNIKISQAEDGNVTFVYNDTTHEIYAGKHVALVGNIQSAIGAAGDWDPATSTTVMLPQKDGTYVYTTTVGKGNYEYKVALNGNWDVNYGQDGKSGGDNLKLAVDKDAKYKFTYDDKSHVIKAEIVLTKKIFPKSIKFEYPNIMLNKGFSYKTTLITNPGLITEKQVSYRSSNRNVATVDATGKITAVSKGTATITARTPYNKTATMTITVR